jgi:hypothetical protein
VPEKIIEKGVRFLVVKKRPSTHQLYHAFHHNLTTKTPRSAHGFLLKPPAKHHISPPQKNPANFRPEKVVSSCQETVERSKLFCI